MAKLRKQISHDGGDWWAFKCPGCKYSHTVPTVRALAGGAWGWNGSVDAPTFTPSIKLTSGDHHGATICHSFVRDGNIEFLADSTHELAGQTVELPEWDD